MTFQCSHSSPSNETGECLRKNVSKYVKILRAGVSMIEPLNETGGAPKKFLKGDQKVSKGRTKGAKRCQKVPVTMAQMLMAPLKALNETGESHGKRV